MGTVFAPGTLVGASNRLTDLDASKNVGEGQVLNLPPGATEDEMIEELFERTDGYPDDLDYDKLPVRNMIDANGYNSNSFAAGLLLASGFRRFHAPPGTPGFELPVPASHFKRSSVVVEECQTKSCE